MRRWVHFNTQLKYINHNNYVIYFYWLKSKMGSSLEHRKIQLGYCFNGNNVLSATLGYPAEIHQYGPMFIWFPIAQAVGAVIGAFTFVSLFYPLKLTCVNEVSYTK